MFDINELDLERVSGGESSGVIFSRMDWYNLNCLYCANKRQCRAAKVKACLEEAERQANEGVVWSCPDKC